MLIFEVKATILMWNVTRGMNSQGNTCSFGKQVIEFMKNMAYAHLLIQLTKVLLRVSLLINNSHSTKSNYTLSY